MNTFGISIRAAADRRGLIVAFIGFQNAFPQQKAHGVAGSESKSERRWRNEPTANIAFVPLAMPTPQDRGPSHDHRFPRFHGASWRRVSRLGHYGRAADYFTVAVICGDAYAVLALIMRLVGKGD